MKKLFTSILVFSFICLFSQEYKEFYVVQKIGHTIEPTTKTVQTNNELNLSFDKQELQDFFQSKVVYAYEKAFPESQNDTLKNTYFIRSNTNLSKTSLGQLSDVLFVEELEFLDNYLMHEPNDYFYEHWGGLGFVKNQTIMDLVRAPLAWEVTKGDPNVIIGIAEYKMNPQHPDLASEILQHFGNTTTGNAHGTGVASIASGATNNSIGFASIGYNTKMITCTADIPLSDTNNSLICVLE